MDRVSTGKLTGTNAIPLPQGWRAVVGRAGSWKHQKALDTDADLLVSLISREFAYYAFGLVIILHYDQ